MNRWQLSYPYKRYQFQYASTLKTERTSNPDNIAAFVGYAQYCTINNKGVSTNVDFKQGGDSEKDYVIYYNTSTAYTANDDNRYISTLVGGNSNIVLNANYVVWPNASGSLRDFKAGTGSSYTSTTSSKTYSQAAGNDNLVFLRYTFKAA